jgi:hypothetical protein
MRTKICALPSAPLLLLLAATAVAPACRRSEAPPPAPAPAAPAPATPGAAPPAGAPAVRGKPGAAEAPAAAGAVAGRVKVEVTEAGFVPDSIPAEAGKPITLAITRKTDRTCAREILFKAQDDKGPATPKTDLPLNKEVEVTYTPKAAGKVAFGCAMGMMIAGVLDVR